MPIRFATDSFGSAVEFVEEDLQDPDAPDSPQQTFMKTALLKSKVPLDCTNKAAVESFVITGSEPADSSRRVIFKIDDALYKFQSGQLVAYTAPGGFGDIIKWGNKVSTLEALSNITAFVGKKIYPIIALQAPSDAAEYPTIKIGLVTRSTNEQLTDTVDSPVYELANDTQTIISIVPDIVTTGAGSANVTVRLRHDGEWSSFMSLASAANRSAEAVQFRIAYAVEQVGSDSAQVKSIVVNHTSGQAVTSGDICNLYSTIADYEVGLKSAYCLVHHAPLVDARIEVYVNFMKAPSRRELVQIGTATGSRQELSLGDSNIVADSLQIFADGLPVYNFDFSTELGTVTLTAAQGAVLTASYNYDFGQETWLKMTADNPLPYQDGDYATRFTYSLDEASDNRVANVRIRLIRRSGNATENLGKATGKTQLFVLKHKPKPSTIAFTEDVNFSYDEATGILSCVAAKNTPLNVSYSWLGDSPIVYSFAAGFAVN
ncbi:MAG: hypothetical protein IJG33_13505 [Selenomonadaceae bacterium]|nr:hypothetical protein [Selenomonadaceae bacterium]